MIRQTGAPAIAHEFTGNRNHCRRQSGQWCRIITPNHDSEANMTQEQKQRMITARMQRIEEQAMARSIALHKFHRGNERRRQNKIAGSMIALIALIIANAWAAKYGWGL
jgi:hypothetical protein